MEYPELCGGPDREMEKRHRKLADYHSLLADFYSLSACDQKIFMAAYNQIVKNFKIQRVLEKETDTQAK